MIEAPESIVYHEMESPIGTLRLAADAVGLCAIRFEQERHPAPIAAHWVRLASADDCAPIAKARGQLLEYFAGQRQHFELALHPRGTPFQLRVWEELRRIRHGVMISYAELARRIDRPLPMRAVGAANGRNPLPIVVPCHRIIGSDGSLVGFSGGLPIKTFLLTLEGALPPDLFDAR